MIIRFNKILPILCMFVVLAIALFGGIKTVSMKPASAGVSPFLPTVVIDAGHGGIDPGR